MTDTQTRKYPAGTKVVTTYPLENHEPLVKDEPTSVVGTVGTRDGENVVVTLDADGTLLLRSWDEVRPATHAELYPGRRAAYGLEIEASQWKPGRSVVAKPERAPAGNLVLRVGRENTPTVEAFGWHQTEHVVMKPDEGRAFAWDVLELLDHGSPDLADDLHERLPEYSVEALRRLSDEDLARLAYLTRLELGGRGFSPVGAGETRSRSSS